MIYWFRSLPQDNRDFSVWIPFIQNSWFRRHYMKFVYLLMGITFLAPGMYGRQSFSRENSVAIAEHLQDSQMALVVSKLTLILIVATIFIIHEILHILVVYKEDISLTFSGIFFWLNTNAVLSKTRFWLFMSLPVIVLSALPAIASIFLSGYAKSFMVFICWVNLIISSSDLFNSLLILMKPNHAIFCRGYYRIK